ncbi:hypothetical protein C8E03_102112 [Lachnotalea glycerini]|uniref:Uncharacterized protein n=1 Tax=Lachnotalea glycerini TaxID=1763509 RepID=A0A255IIM9_9FIRM|nr:hypothetical protein [Lachnotalea glycerini]PXV93344.1 hypothetical protein C8E03_102112 [Lachnotalea glycerini]RDY31994.1 hypothetical protein CG710_006745 [Lachnotalea glycerini]
MELMITRKIDDLFINTQCRMAKFMESREAVVIFIISAAIILALGITAGAGVAIYCMAKGGNVDWSFGVVKVWKMGLPNFQFKCILK